MNNVRKATIKDIQSIARFNQAMSLETESKSLSSDLIIPGVTYLVEHPEAGFYLVAETQGQLSGCLGITYEWSDWRQRFVLVDTICLRRARLSTPECVYFPVRARHRSCQARQCLWIASVCRERKYASASHLQKVRYDRDSLSSDGNRILDSAIASHTKLTDSRILQVSRD